MLGSHFTRRTALRGAAGAAASAYALGRVRLPEAAAATRGLTDAYYWRFADALMALVDADWDDEHDLYGIGDTQINAYLLHVHATAALHGHTGAARQDARARRLAVRMCRKYPWVPGPNDPPPPGEAQVARTQTHHHGWSPSMYGPSYMHVVIDTTVIRALTQVVKAAGALGLAADATALVRQRVLLSADDGFYAYPALRLNQISWPIEIYAASVALGGPKKLLREDAGKQFRRWARGITHPMPGMTTPNLQGGYRFTYLPQSSPRVRSNFDSPEYALIVIQALRFYGAARKAGMPALPATHRRRLRAWVQRCLSGYWTHGGYLNWDTGLGFDRWHQGKKHGLAQLGLLAIATSPEFQPSPAYGRYAKYFFDRGIERYAAFVRDAGNRIPRAVAYEVTKTEALPSDDRLWLARMASNAALAVDEGMGSLPSSVPPPLYSFDPDTCRLAITTPAYNTAVVPVNQNAFPYGGLELARLFDGDQRVAANIGGRVPAAFGVTVRGPHGTLTTQRAERFFDADHPRLRLLRAPRGRGTGLRRYPERPYAGAFSAIDAEGWTRRAFAAVRTRHRFRAAFVQTEWTVVPRKAPGDHTVRAHFPSWGPGARITLHRSDGTTSGPRGDLRDVQWIHVASRDAGYVIVPAGGRFPRARVGQLQPEAQSSNPSPGPTLVIELLSSAKLRRTGLAVRIAPARGAADASSVASHLLR